MNTTDRINRIYLLDFIAESNRIEGISREDVPPESQHELYRDFISLPKLTVEDLARFVAIIQPHAKLRDKPGMNVYVGDHVPPTGGAHIPLALAEILAAAERGVASQRAISPSAHRIHCDYETLHPFQDGNGRSGRALWAWMMHRAGYRLNMGFLHLFYYQTLAALQGRA